MSAADTKVDRMGAGSKVDQDRISLHLQRAENHLTNAWCELDDIEVSEGYSIDSVDRVMTVVDNLTQRLTRIRATVQGGVIPR
jgi:hypothetical protein